MHYSIFSMLDARQTVNMGNWNSKKKYNIVIKKIEVYKLV